MAKKQEPAASVPHVMHVPAVPGAYRLREETDPAGPTIALPIRLIDPDLPWPSYATPGAAAFDLFCRQSCTIGAHAEAMVPLNVVVHVPANWGLFLMARSSTLKRRGLILGNGVGLVDPDYRGDSDEVMASLHNIRNVPVMVERGERLVQALLLPVPRVTFVPITEDAPDRGGFGSTGTH